MKVVIFAGGFGTRISEESFDKPKPMIEIGERPLLWHLMKIYEAHGFRDFILCLGYKGSAIKQYFLNYRAYNSDITVDLGKSHVEVHRANTDSFRVTMVDTGLYTQTAGRLKMVQSYIGDEEFMLTYGDGLADVDLNKLLAYHRGHGKIATVTAVQPAGRFGLLGIDSQDVVKSFKEKPAGSDGWINGGFFVLRPEVFSYLPPDAEQHMWEGVPLERLSREGQLRAYRHFGFWRCMDAARDKVELEALWSTGQARWKNWK